jgi:hypothetical protein
MPRSRSKFSADRPRVLHVSHFRHVPAGVLNQLFAEASAVKKLGIPWEIALVSNPVADVPFLTPIPPRQLKSLILSRLYFWNWLMQQRERFDFLLLRHVPADPFAPFFVPFFPDRASIHHTKEIEELSLRDDRLRTVWAAHERLIGTNTIRSGRAVVAVTGDILKYELARIRAPRPGFVSPNGIDVGATPLAKDRRDGPAQILFIASVFSPWHGLDLLLDSLPRCGLPYRLHLIGEIPPSLLARVEEVNRLGENIIVHGTVPQSKVFEVAADCDIGIASFDFDRLGMTETSPLKVREYLAQGLPVYAGYPDGGLPADFPYYTVGLADLETIIRKALAMRNTPRAVIRAAAIPFIDKAALIQRLYGFICSVSGS